jgi:hypothetical protein
MVGFGIVLIISESFTRRFICSPISGAVSQLGHGVRIVGHCAAGGAGIRICQRLSRYRERGGDRDLYPLPRAAYCGGVVGILELLRSAVSSGLVAFGIISLLPVELILQVGSKAGFAMVFALLVAAIIWNLGTWYFGLPASSSHT